MKKLASLSFAIISLIGISSCSNDDTTAGTESIIDTTKPTIQIITPTDDQEIEPGSVLNFKADLKDNIGLASYKVEVHSAEDGHQHKAKQLEAEEFHYDFSAEVSSKSPEFTVEKSINVPEDVKEGHYHVGITVLDVNGNQNQQFVEIFIGHDHEH
ncbi:DUF4625 domain-containing protein [Flavobacterium dauae]|uniref:DUF4625 domain-containing protein n=1 Tax=Flavobacterium dauae TaxID=1563479 RepID=UPI00101B238D|nr:DUF4625 domain-containing protein [Flavobacterium dauae]WLD24440.1 DUF4625 domain-containing protein [Flavobacterium dauae]